MPNEKTPKTPSSTSEPRQKPETNRCPWCLKDPIYIEYHDTEWGRPIHNDQQLFELLTLESMQAGLSWLTILLKRESFRRAFDHFDPRLVAKYDEKKVSELLNNPGIIRNRKKIEAAIHNASKFLELQKQYGSFDSYIWQFVEGKPLINQWNSLEEVPCRDARSDHMARELKRMGFAFVGTKICYSFMQAVGMVHDHLTSCFLHEKASSIEKDAFSKC